MRHFAKAALDLAAGTFTPALTRVRGCTLILCYHRIREDVPPDPFASPVTTVPLEALRRQLEWLGGFARFITLDEILEHPQATGWRIAVTFDDGYRDNIELGEPLFRRLGIPVSWFIVSDFARDPQRLPWWDLAAFLDHLRDGEMVVETTPSESRRLDLSRDPDRRWLQDALHRYNRQGPHEGAVSFTNQVRAGLEKVCDLPPNGMARPEELQAAHHRGIFRFGCHTASHPNLALLPTATQREEILGCQRQLEAWSLQPIPWFAYPFGKSTWRSEETPRIIEDSGFRGALTTRPGSIVPGSEPYALPRLSVDGRWPLSRFKTRILFVRG